MPAYDLKITNARLVDGTGSPAQEGELAVVDGRIVAVGEAPGEARSEIDAGGHVLAPGFIDIHTHYDVQILWDKMLSISPWHGVTSVVMGNCGFGISPTRPEHRESLLRTLQHVEGMEYVSTSTGLGDDWGFETFPEYIDLLERRGTAINVGVLIGHTALKLFVMGHEASERHPTDDEIVQMQEIVREALQAGAIGFSTSNSPAHFGDDGNPVPSRITSYEELKALVGVLAEENAGTFQATWGPELNFENLERLLTETRVPISDPGLSTRRDMSHLEKFEFFKRMQEQGHFIYPQVSCRPTMFEFSLADPFMIALDQPALAQVKPLKELFVPILNVESTEARLAAYQDPDFRDRFRAETDEPGWNSRLWPHIRINDVPGRPEFDQRSIVEAAAGEGLHPSELLYDLSMETNLGAKFAIAFTNNDPAEVEKLLRSPHTRLGLSDAGAHQSQLCDACYPTYLLGHWVREQQVLTLERAVQMLTSLEADLYGIPDRGVLLPGYAADLVIFDPETVHTGPLERVNDLPAGASRIISMPTGIDRVFVNGIEIRRDNTDIVSPDAPLPGQVIKNARRPMLPLQRAVGVDRLALAARPT